MHGKGKELTNKMLLAALLGTYGALLAVPVTGATLGITSVGPVAGKAFAAY